MMKNTKKKLPLISVIIPTFCRPKLFKIALDSVLAQTYKNYEIFITDNSPDKETWKVMQPYLAKYKNIIYEHHPEYTKARQNYIRACEYNNPDAEYVQWLMDDDVFMPNKFELMIDKFLKYGNLSLVTSVRDCIDIDGNYITTIGFPVNSDEDKIFKGRAAGRVILEDYVNYIGEPTTPLIKKSAMKNGILGGVNSPYDEYFIADFPTWLKCLKHGDVYCFGRALSQFRLHADQEQRSPRVRINGMIVWAMEIINAIQEKYYLTNNVEAQNALDKWLGTMLPNVIAQIEEKGFYEEKIFNDWLNIAEELLRLRKNIEQ